MRIWSQLGGRAGAGGPARIAGAGAGVAILALIGGLTGCGHAAIGSPTQTMTTASGPVASAPTSTAASAPTTAPPATAPSTTRPVPATSTTAAAIQEPQRISEPVAAARWLYDSWRAGDRRRALRFASSTAVDAMFAVSPSRSLRYSHCTYRLAGYDCIFAFATPTPSPDAVMRVEGGASAGYRVTSVFVLEQQRISDPKQAAALLVAAWLADDRPLALRRASTDVVDALFRLARTPAPAFTGCQYRDGGFDCTYHGASAFVLRVTGGASAGYRVTAIRIN
jgi:hypothetical protein